MRYSLILLDYTLTPHWGTDTGKARLILDLIVPEVAERRHAKVLEVTPPESCGRHTRSVESLIAVGEAGLHSKGNCPNNHSKLNIARVFQFSNSHGAEDTS